MILRKHTISQIIYIRILLACFLVIPTQGIAQNFIVQQGSATVPIVNENLVQAENKAMFKAKQTIIQKVLPQFLDTKVLTQVQKQINARMLKQPDQFIESIRILETSESEDLKKFSLLLEARIFKDKIISHLKQLNLSLLDDPTRQVTLFYDPKDTVWGNTQKKKTIRTLNQLFKPYKLHIQTAKPLTSKWVKNLTANPKQSLSQQIISNSKNQTLLFLNLQLRQLSSKKAKKALSAKLQLTLYDASNGKYLSQVQTTKTFNNWNAKQDFARLLKPLSLKWDPLIATLISTEKTSGTPVNIKLSGLATPQQETIFLQNILNQQGFWDHIQLYTLTKDSTIYYAVYSGNRKTLISHLKKTNFPSYKIQQAVWNSDQLEIKVQWQETVTPLESYYSIDRVEQWVQRHKTQPPQKRVPPEKLKTLYVLPSGIGVYDLLRSRGDSTFFKVESKNPGQTMTGKWQRIGNTNLSPLLSVYDAQHHLVERYTPKRNGVIEFQYKLPKDHSHFYIRINDQIGYLEEEAGSYLFVHYILQISSS